MRNFAAAALFLAACSGSEGSVHEDAADAARPSGEGDPRVARDAGGDAATPVSQACPRAPRPDDAARSVVISHNFAADGAQSNTYEVLSLASDGTLARTGTTFAMGVSADAPIAFTPDGRIGIAPQNDGSLGVFELASDGASVRVVAASYKGEFYAQKVYIDDEGTRVTIVDSQIAANGGGLYQATIGCDGSLSAARKVAETDGIGALGAFHATPGRFLASAGAGFGVDDADTHVVDFGGGGMTPVAKATVFSERTIVTAIALSSDDQVGVLARSNAIAGPTELAVVSFRGGALSKRATIPIEMPAIVLGSPFGNAFFVATVDPDAFYLLGYDPTNAASPVTNKGALPSRLGKPELPAVAVTIDRGKLKGRILVAEVSAVRSLQFSAEGTVEEIGKLPFPKGFENIVGTLGVTP